LEWDTAHSTLLARLDELEKGQSALSETLDGLQRENSILVNASKELERENALAQEEARAKAAESAVSAAAAASSRAEAEAQRRRAAELDARLDAISKLRLVRLHRTLQSKEPLAFKFAHSGYLIAAQCTPEPLRRFVRPYLNRLKAWRRRKLFFEGSSEPLRIRQEAWPADRPLVSVIVPSYNYGKYIGDLLDSLQAQTFQDFEIIVVDCSDCPETLAIVGKIQHPKIRVFFRNGRHQLGDNRNFGIRRARGKYVCTIDPDDKVLPTYFEKALYILETENCQICAPSLRSFGDSTESWVLQPVPQLPDLLNFNQISVVALFDRAYWKRAGGYHDYGEGKQHVHEDWDFWVRLMALGARVRNMREELMLYRRHVSQMSKDKEIPSLDDQRIKIHDFNRRHLTPRNFRRSVAVQAGDFDVMDGDRNLVSGYRNGRQPKSSILFVLPYLVVGGAERRFNEIARFLRMSGWQVTVTTTDPIDPRQIDTTSEFESITSEIYHLPRFLEQRRWRKFLSYLIKSRNIETVLLGGSSWFYAELPDFRREHPEVKVYDQQFNTACHFDSNRKFSEYIDHTIAENEIVFRELIGPHAESPDKVSLLYNGVGIGAPRQNISGREKLGLPVDKVVVAYIGRLSEEKGPDIFVDIAENLAEHERISWLLAGPGLLYDSIREGLADRELQKLISMPGMVDASAYLDAIDVLVVPSRIDGRPNIVLEAFARGIPVVASAVGGLPGIIAHGVNGMLCPSGDVEAFSKAICSLVESEKLRASLGAAARLYAERELDSESRLRRYVKLFSGERIESDTPIMVP
jgi:glycosyltransferase involved in cell wall biosynthesis